MRIQNPSTFVQEVHHAPVESFPGAGAIVDRQGEKGEGRLLRASRCLAYRGFRGASWRGSRSASRYRRSAAGARGSAGDRQISRRLTSDSSDGETAPGSGLRRAGSEDLQHLSSLKPGRLESRLMAVVHGVLHQSLAVLERNGPPILIDNDQVRISVTCIEHRAPEMYPALLDVGSTCHWLGQRTGVQLRPHQETSRHQVATSEPVVLGGARSHRWIPGRKRVGSRSVLRGELHLRKKAPLLVQLW